LTLPQSRQVANVVLNGEGGIFIRD